MFSIGRMKALLASIPESPDSEIEDSGSVSMETIMDTVTRVLASVAVLGAIFGLLITAYSGIGKNIKTVQNSGQNAITTVSNQVGNTSWINATP